MTQRVDDLVAVAKIARARGLRGEVVADVLTDFPERFDVLERVTAVKPDGLQVDLKIERFWFQNGRIVLKFEGLDSVEEAEGLRDAEVCIRESEAVELADDEFFDWELQGCSVETVEGEHVGIVKELMRAGGTEILVVEGGEKEFLIPFAAAICVEIDLEGKSIKIDPPEGLLEF